MITKTCSECRKTFESSPNLMDSFEIGEAERMDREPTFKDSPCPACDKAAEDRRRKHESDITKGYQAKQREVRWLDVCPPLYRDTDLDHPSLSRAAVEMVRGWDMQTGIGLTGETGKGKTRLLYVALRKVLDDERTIEAVTHTQFSRTVQAAFASSGEEQHKAKAALTRYTKYRCLLLDDLGKASSTERADAELEDLIEYRTSHSLPILWTSNGAGGWLEHRFGSDRGPAIMRRLTEFCQCIRA